MPQRCPGVDAPTPAIGKRRHHWVTRALGGGNVLSRSERRSGPETDFNRRCRNLYLQFSIHFGKQLCQIADLDILNRPHGALDVTAQLRADMACRELVELGADLLPAEWAASEIQDNSRYLVAERLTAFKPHGYPARELGRKTGREALVWFHADVVVLTDEKLLPAESDKLALFQPAPRLPPI
jgi:hypothetical protein